MAAPDAPARTPPPEPVAPAWRVPFAPGRDPRHRRPPSQRRSPPPPPPPRRDGCDEYAKGAHA